jgi:hypothetical protein
MRLPLLFRLDDLNAKGIGPCLVLKGGGRLQKIRVREREKMGGFEQRKEKTT